MIDCKVRVHCRNNLVIIHWILGFSQAQLSQLLRDDSFLEVSNLSTLTFAQARFETVAFHSAVVAAVFLAEPAEERALADEACLQNFLVGCFQHFFLSWLGLVAPTSTSYWYKIWSHLHRKMQWASRLSLLCFFPALVIVRAKRYWLRSGFEGLSASQV